MSKTTRKMQKLAYSGPIGWLEYAIVLLMKYSTLQLPFVKKGKRFAYAMGWFLSYKGVEYVIFQGKKKAEDYQTVLPKEFSELKFEGNIDLPTASVPLIPHGLYGSGGKLGFSGDKDFTALEVEISVSERVVTEKDGDNVALMPIGIINFGEVTEDFWNQLHEPNRNALILERSKAKEMLEGKAQTDKVVVFVEEYC